HAGCLETKRIGRAAKATRVPDGARPFPRSFRASGPVIGPPTFRWARGGAGLPFARPVERAPHPSGSTRPRGASSAGERTGNRDALRPDREEGRVGPSRAYAPLRRLA